MRPVPASSLLVLLASPLFGCTAAADHSPPPPAGAQADTGTGSGPAAPSETRLVLSGRYESPDGPFSQITFYDDAHYVATKRPGDPGDVASLTHGTYTIDPAAQTLSLKDDLTGEVKSGPLHVTQSDTAPPSLASGTTTKALKPDDLLGSVGSVIVGAVSLLVGAFTWLGSWLGAAFGPGGGFNSNQFDCNAYGTMGPNGGYVSTAGLPNIPRVRVSTSQGSAGARFIHVDSFAGGPSGSALPRLAPQPFYNGYTRYDDGYWSSLDPDMIGGLEGNMYYQDPSGPYAFHCTPY